MRITKHRGKREDNGEWVYGAFYPIKDEYVFFIINNCKSIDFDDDDTTFNGHKVHKKSVGEFTGLLDKNGKEVFEGDIFELGAVEWIDGAFRFKNSNCYMVIDSHIAHNFEIIGNIFENAELVKL